MHILDWTTDRPKTEGTYWLSMPPDTPYYNQPRCREVYVSETQRCMLTLDFEAPDASDRVLVVGGDDEAATVTWPDSARDMIDIHSATFDGAQWAQREMPADPFAQPTEAPSGKCVILDTRQIVGNCAMFWRADGAGYTCDLNDAGLYDKTEGRRDTDIYVPIEVARKMSVTHVRVEPLREAGYWSKPQPKKPQRCGYCPRFVRRGEWLCKKCWANKEKIERSPS